MSTISMEKEAAVNLLGAVAALIEHCKGTEAKLAEANEKLASVKTASAESVETAARKSADVLLAGGFITKEGYDRTVENLSDPVTGLVYLNKAISMLGKANTKTAAEDSEPKPVGKGVSQIKYPTVKTSKDRLEEAGRTFEQRLGL